MSTRDIVKQTPLYAALMAAGIPEPHGFYVNGDTGITLDYGFSIEWSLSDAWELDVTVEIREIGEITGDATNTARRACMNFELDADATDAEVVRAVRGMFEFAGHPLPELETT